MLSVGRFVVLCMLFIYVSTNEFRKTKDMQHGRNHLSLLGLKFGQKYVSRTPFFIQAPIIIMPQLTQQQSVILLPTSTVEQFQELNNAINVVKPSKDTIIDEVKIEQNELNNNIMNEKDNVNKIIKEESHPNLKRDISSKIKSDSNANKISLRQSNFTSNSTVMAVPSKNSNTTVNVPDVTNTTVSTENVNNTTTTTTQSTTNNTTETPIPSGIYPSAKYNNSFINEIIFTTPSTYILEGDHNANMLPHDDEKWRNFSTNSGNIYPSFEGFKPLAGLYYDGFLHKMLIKENGWSPLLN